MSGNGPVTYADLRPRRRAALVGDVEMVVREMVIEKWERFTEVIATAVKWAEVLKPLGALLPGRGQKFDAADALSAVASNAEALGGVATALVRDVLGKSLPQLALVAVDYPENDRAVAVATDRPGATPLPDATLKGVAVEYARENMTPRQAVAVLDALVEVNDFGDLLGKSGDLLKRAARAFRQVAGGAEPAAPPEPAPPTTH